MNKRNMELSDKEYDELAEKLDAEQVILEDTDLINNQFENLLKHRIILINDIISNLTIDKLLCHCYRWIMTEQVRKLLFI